MSKRKRKSSRIRSLTPRNVASGESPPSQHAAPGLPEQVSLDEYDYVSQDLRQVTLLAAAMFALLIGLSFFIG
jgi:hypothetical protein